MSARPRRSVMICLRETSERKEFTDEYIHIAQQLLHKQFPTLDGLQPTVPSQNNGFCSVKSESIQVHHTGEFHWVTSCSIGGEIAVHESKYSVGDLPPSLQAQIYWESSYIRRRRMVTNVERLKCQLYGNRQGRWTVAYLP